MRVLLVTAMYPTPENPAYGAFVYDQVYMLREAGVHMDVLHMTGPSRKWAYFKGMVQLNQILATRAIDLVHAHYSYAGFVARMQWKVPVVVTFHGDDLQGTRNEQGNLTFDSKFIILGGQVLAMGLDASIVQNRTMAHTLRHTRNVNIISHEIDFDMFRIVNREEARSLLELDPQKKYLLFAANPAIAVKRFPLAKEVAEYLTSRDPSVELIVIHKEPRDRLVLYMNACDALVFPSFQEGSPNIIKQAMACNLPIVSTDVGDVRDIIGQTRGCYICNPNVQEFAERLTDILERRERTQGRENVKHLDKHTVAQRIIQLYETTIANHRARTRKRITA